ncbi:MAG: hypothetical protein MUC63_07300 [Planctomycetes bacterium]|nr:hypothetical protein [Planctomycetota bacterium]
MRTTGIFAAAMLAALALPAAVRGADADPFGGKSLDDVRRILETRMEERKKDRDFARDYQAFAGKEEKRISRWGGQLAADARGKVGEYAQAELLYRFGEHVKALEVLIPFEKKLTAKGRQPRNFTTILVYRLSAICYAWVDRVPEAVSALGHARRAGDVGNQLNKIQKDVTDLPALRRDLDDRRGKRNLDPRNADKQWALCEFYQQKIFAPLEETVELLWMIKSFPEHAKVKSGDADWGVVAAAEKLFDVRQLPSQAEKFRKAFPDHWAQRQGDLQWAVSKALFGAGNYKEAKKAADLLKRQYPKFHRVENKEVDSFLSECDTASSSKGPPVDEGDHWNHWWDWPAG